MEQFLYECFGKTHKLSGYIFKENKIINENPKKDDTKSNKEEIQNPQIEEPEPEKSKKDNQQIS